MQVACINQRNCCHRLTTTPLSFLEMRKYQSLTFTQRIWGFAFTKPDQEQSGLVFYIMTVLILLFLSSYQLFKPAECESASAGSSFCFLLSLGSTQRRSLGLTLGNVVKCVVALHRKVCILQEQGHSVSYLGGLGQEYVSFLTDIFIFVGYSE